MQLPRPGDDFEGYEIGDVLGSGGFACVYNATEPTLGRSVALKILTPSQGKYDPRLEQRFMREAKAVASLEDAHTLRLFSFGRASNGLLYMAFERLGGQDVSTLLATRGRLSEPEVVHVIRQVLTSLREAHGQGLLHRDIKPENVRVFEHLGDPLFVKVMDFGIAKSIVEPDTPLTRTGALVGTPRYMAPEQLMDDPLTPAADIFSVGLLAHDMLFGMDSRGRPAVTGIEIGPEAPISAELRAVLNRALVAVPEARFGGAQQMLHALDAPPPAEVRTRQPDSHPIATAPQRAIPWAVIGALTCITVVAVAGLYFRDGAPLESQPHVARTRGNPLGEAPLPPPSVQPQGGDQRVAATPAAAGAPPSGCGDESHPVGQSELTDMDGLRAIPWPIYVPKSYDASTPAPLVILIHDQLASPGRFIRHDDLISLADANGFVMFAPEDNMVDPWLGSEATEIILQGTDAVRRNLCIDPDRIYAVGHGRGSVVAESLPCHMKLAGIATTNYTSGANTMPRCRTRTPAIHLHGMDDPFHPGEGGENCAGKPRQSIATRDARWLANRTCESQARIALTHKNGKCFDWDCDVRYVSCHLRGGHNWPGIGDRIIDTAGCENAPPNFPYATTIWKFFQDGKVD